MQGKKNDIKRKAGRPKADIDWEKVTQYLQSDCKVVEIASHLGISTDTLYIRCKQDNNIDFSLFTQQKKQSGDVLLKVVQFNSAIKGNTTMQIWLGKNRLGQSDKQEIETHDSRTLTEIFKAMVSAS